MQIGQGRLTLLRGSSRRDPAAPRPARDRAAPSPVSGAIAWLNCSIASVGLVLLLVDMSELGMGQEESFLNRMASW